LHHTLIAHSSGPNRSDDWRIGIGISYIPTSVRHIGPTRLSATLARGTDRFNHFDHEAAPQAELDAAALAVHATRNPAIGKRRRISPRCDTLTGRS
jgi:hypothetical protein